MKLSEVADLCTFIRENFGSGAITCCLHIAIDDLNLTDENIDFCITESETKGHFICKIVAEELRRHTLHWRYKVSKMSWGFTTKTVPERSPNEDRPTYGGISF